MMFTVEGEPDYSGILPLFSQLPYRFAANEPQSGAVHEGSISPLQTAPGTPVSVMGDGLA